MAHSRPIACGSARLAVGARSQMRPRFARSRRATGSCSAFRVLRTPERVGQPAISSRVPLLQAGGLLSSSRKPRDGYIRVEVGVVVHSLSERDRLDYFAGVQSSHVSVRTRRSGRTTSEWTPRIPTCFPAFPAPEEAIGATNSQVDHDERAPSRTSASAARAVCTHRRPASAARAKVRVTQLRDL